MLTIKLNMKYLLILAVTALVFLSDAAPAAERPNIVLILGDDQAGVTTASWDICYKDTQPG